MASQSKNLRFEAACGTPSQVATVQIAGKILEAGGKVGPLDREMHVGGSTYTHQVIERSRKTAMLISAGAIRALRHKGFLKDMVLPVEA